MSQIGPTGTEPGRADRPSIEDKKPGQAGGAVGVIARTLLHLVHRTGGFDPADVAALEELAHGKPEK